MGAHELLSWDESKGTHSMPRRSPAVAYRGTAHETRRRFETLEGRLASLQDELWSVFSLVMEDRKRLEALEGKKGGG